jgi:hypothetical protein
MAIFSGDNGDNTFVVVSGSNSYDGAGGTDTLNFASTTFRQATTTKTGPLSGTVRVGNDVTTFANVEELAFSDGRLSFDTAGRGAQVFRLYDTAFGSAPDQAGFEFWSDSLQGGLSLRQAADLFLSTAAGQAKFGGLDGAGFVSALYQQALGRTGSPSEVSDWVAQLSSAGATRADVLAAFSESAEHVGRTAASVQVGLWDSSSTGSSVTGTASAPPGYRVVLADDFSNGYNKAHWGDPFPLPWPPGPSANGAYIWDPSDVNVRNGEMQVTIRQHDDGHWSSTGFNSFKAGIGITYGRVEFDARAEAGKGTVFGVLMWPSDDTFPPEIDILETPENTGLFTLHWGQGDGGSWPIRDTSFDPSQWHHYTMEWLPSGVTIWADGQIKGQWADNSPNVKMSFGALGFVGSSYDSWMGGPPDSTTPSLLTLHLDNVVMSQWEGIA